MVYLIKTLENSYNTLVDSKEENRLRIIHTQMENSHHQAFQKSYSRKYKFKYTLKCKKWYCVRYWENLNEIESYKNYIIDDVRVIFQ